MTRTPADPNGHRETSAPGATPIPLVTVRRLYRYIRALEGLLRAGHDSVSSELLAATVGVKASQLRKDLAYFGEFGIRGKGYGVEILLTNLSQALGLTREWPLAIVGVGHIGTALSRYTGLAERGFVVRAMFDIDPALVGTTLGGIRIHDFDALEDVCRQEKIALGILTVPAPVAQLAADRLIAGGVRALLNIAPITLNVPAGVSVRNVDITVELRLLSYMLIAEGGARPAHTPARQTAARKGDE